MMSPHPFLHRTAIASLVLAHGTAHALPAAPATITREPSALSGQVALSWSAVSGATGYNVKRGTSPSSTPTTLGTVATTNFTDATAAPGTPYFYTVTTTDASGESPPTRGIVTGTGVIVDDGASGTSFTGSWGASSVAGFYGTGALFASPATGAAPTATYTFTPTLPARGNYDVYLRWTTNTNRATNTPVDLVFPDGQRTITVDQEQNNGTWVILSTITAEAGSTASVTIRNNGANGNVIADAVQFVPRLTPWAPAADAPQDYALAPVDENFDGSTLNTSVWSTFLSRGEHSVSSGRLHTKLRYKGTVPIGSATTVDLETEANWAEGGIVADQAQKFGYHEARVRLPQLPASGVDTAYWHGATDELLHGYEIDGPEFFNKDADGSSNSYGFGVWDHVLPTRARPGLSAGRTWNYGANYSTLGDTAQYVTVGLEWRTDNSQVVYINGREIYTTPTSGMNDVESILPSNIILSTKVLDWAHPNAALDGAEATWDYARYYQKPGFLGTVDSDWTKPENWGPDGKPAPGYAAVFNMSNAPAAISLPTDQELQSLFIDGSALPAHTFSGPGALRLGAAKPGDDSVTHGGILVNTTVANNQTFTTPVVGLQNLQFANLSRTAGTTLFLNGTIAGDGIAPRDVDFISPLPAATPSTGMISLGQPLGTGIRHINRAGDISFTLPANSQHTGELRVARGPVVIPEISSLGTTPNSAVEFGPRYQHSDSWRPRLTFTGPAATSAHPIRLGGWQADGVLESSGTGPLTWSGDLIVAPYSGDSTRVLTRTPKFTLGGTNTAGNVFSGNISDTGVIVTWKNTDGSDNSGPAILSINKAGSGTWVLGGNNAYSGSTTLGGGTLAVSSFNSVNGGTPVFPTSSLGTPKTVDSGTIDITSGTLKYTGPGEATDRVINLAGSSGATLDHSGTGLLKFTSDFTSSATTKTLTLTGTGTGEIASTIPNNSSTNKTNLAKSGTGTWKLSGSNTYTGTTTISAGTLAVDGSVATGGSLTVSTSAATLTGIGTIATASTISGTLVASPLTFTNTLTLGSAGKLLANFTGNNANGISPVTGSTVTVNSGAKVDVRLNAAGSTTNFLQSYWRTARTIPLLTATSKTGTLAIGTVTNDSAGNPASTYGSFSLQQTTTAVNLVWTPVPGFPVIDTPTLSLVSPATNPVAITDTATSLRIAANIGGGATPAWSFVSGPGTVTFGNPAAADTTAQFSAAGTYVLRATASNALGTLQTEFTVLVNPITNMTFRQGVNSYIQDTTFIRGDNLPWNSGARNEFLVGRNNGGLRGLLAFDLTSVPAGASVQSASLNLWMSGLGTGTSLSSLDLHELFVPFTEGTGDGSNATNGQGSGADWTNRVPTVAWAAPGASETTEFASTPLRSITGPNPSASPAGTALSFPSNSAMVSAVTSAISAGKPLDFMLKIATDSAGSNAFVRIASDDNANQGYRPLLSITLGYDFAPTINPGTAPTPASGASAPLAGTVANATGSLWSKLSGPGSVIFTDASASSTTAVFSTAGTYQLKLTAANANGETSRTLSVTVLSAFTNLESWRQTHFNTTSNTGNAADSADPDFDGLSNLLEYATGTLPKTSNGPPGSLVKNGAALEFTYPRSLAAVADGFTFTAEWSDTLGNDWSASQITQAVLPGTNNGTTELWKATAPAGTAKRFLHLRITAP